MDDKLKDHLELVTILKIKIIRALDGKKQLHYQTLLSTVLDDPKLYSRYLVGLKAKAKFGAYTNAIQLKLDEHITALETQKSAKEYIKETKAMAVEPYGTWLFDITYIDRIKKLLKEILNEFKICEILDSSNNVWRLN